LCGESHWNRKKILNVGSVALIVDVFKLVTVVKEVIDFVDSFLADFVVTPDRDVSKVKEALVTLSAVIASTAGVS
jgi:hypothetical protein